MTKLLFSISTKRVVDLRTLQPVMEELVKTTDYKIVALTDINQDIEDYSNGRILYKHINEYKTKNVNKILEIEKPDLIVIAVNSIIEMAFMIAGNSKSIPTLFVSHIVFALPSRSPLKVIQEKLHTLFLRSTRQQLAFFVCSGLSHYIIRILRRSLIMGYYSGMEYATQICATGNKEKAALINQGIDAGKITVTGQPRFDVLHSDRWKESREKVFKEFGFSFEDKLVLIVTQPWVEEHLWSVTQRKSFIAGLLAGIRTIPGYVPMIKVHPRESADSYRKILEILGLSAVPIVYMGTPLYDLLSASDVVIGVSSTAMLEAMIFDKTVIMANFFNEPDYFGFVSSGVAVAINNEKDLPSILESVSYDEDFKAKLAEARSKFVHNNAYIQDGMASQRIVKLIVQMIER